MPAPLLHETFPDAPIDYRREAEQCTQALAARMAELEARLGASGQ